MLRKPILTTTTLLDLFPSDDYERVKYSLKIISIELAKQPNPPTNANKFVLPTVGTRDKWHLSLGKVTVKSVVVEEEETIYLWTAAMVLGMRSPIIKFNHDAIVCLAVRVGRLKDFPADQLGSFFSTFSKTSLYETKFKQHVEKALQEIKKEESQREEKLREEQQKEERLKKEKLEEEHRRYVEKKAKEEREALFQQQTKEKQARGTLDRENQGWERGKSEREINEKLKIQVGLEEKKKRDDEEREKQEAEIKRQEDIKRRQEEQKRKLEEENNRKLLQEKKIKNSIELISYCARTESRPNISWICKLIEEGADIDYQESSQWEGHTAVMMATSNQNDSAAEYLLKIGANLFLTNNRGQMAIDFASTGSSIFEVLQTKQKEKDLNQEPKQVRLNRELHEEVINISVQVRKIRSILDEGAFIDYQDNNGYSALMLAVDMQNDRVVQYLLKLGANPLLKNKYGELASDMAASDTPIFELLKEKEILAAIARKLIKPLDGYSQLLFRYVSGADVRAQMIDHYIDMGASLNYQNSKNYTSLMIVVDKGNEAIAEYLLKCGANPLLKNSNGKMASDWASKNSGIYHILKGYELIFLTVADDMPNIQILLNTEESIINFKWQEGYTPLLIAVAQGSIELVRYLLLRSADLSLCCENGESVFDLGEDQQIQELLRNASEQSMEEATLLNMVSSDEEKFEPSSLQASPTQQKKRYEFFLDQEVTRTESASGDKQPRKEESPGMDNGYKSQQ